MSVFDATAVNMAAGAPGGVANQGADAGKSDAPGEGEKPAPKENGSPEGSPKEPDDGAEGKRPKARQAVEAILDKYGLTTPEELKEFMDGLTGLKSKIGEADLDEIMESHETLKSYRKEWAKQEREKLKENETPEETIKRLEHEREEIDARVAKGERQRKQSEAAKRSIEEFSRTVVASIEVDDSIPEEYRPFTAALLGVKNPINDVDIRDKAAVRKACKSYGAKMVKDFEQAVIKRYRDGKSGLPPTPPPAGGGGAPVAADGKAKNLTEARRLAHQSLSALFGRK
jgi:site-specific DNA-cytosine methylase